MDLGYSPEDLALSRRYIRDTARIGAISMAVAFGAFVAAWFLYGEVTGLSVTALVFGSIAALIGVTALLVRLPILIYGKSVKEVADLQRQEDRNRALRSSVTTD